MARKARRRPVFEPIEIEAPESTPTPTVPSLYIQSTHYTTNNNGYLSSTLSRLLPVPDTQPERDHGSGNSSTVNNSFPDVLETDFSAYLSTLNDVEDPEELPSQNKKKRRVDRPLADWLPYRDRFLSELLRLEARNSNEPMCSECFEAPGIYRCLECDGMDLVCQSCCLKIHKRSPLHWIEAWCEEKKFFQCVTLKSMGQVIQLGHSPGHICFNPEPCYAGSFTILDTCGTHDVYVNFCNCDRRQPHYVQLLRFGWFPATISFPRTAFTLRLLKHFQILSFESKLTVYEYHQTLQRLTDNTGTQPKRDRYDHFLRVVREYRHLKMLKRAGRGHSLDGAMGTRHGECAVLCPACPHPGINLEPDWKDAPPNKRFLYRLFLGMDANFRLKRRLISSHAADPSLSSGWSYFVEEDNYKEFLSTFGTLIIQEQSQCSNHNAVNKERGKEGFAASGVGACDCIRHDMKRPCAVGDLQKGERYVNMDYLFFGSLANTEYVEVVASYDIMCQYSIHLWDRMKQYPHWLHVDHENRTTFHFLIPKFHLPAHIRPCQTRYSFNYNKYVGRTDGEAPERGWSRANALAPSTREMAPGARRDTLDDHFGDSNWGKSTEMAYKIIAKVKEAVSESVAKAKQHDDFSKTIGPEDIAEWSAQLDGWENDHEKFNPFESTYEGISLESVRRRLADQEEADAIGGSVFIVHEEISASRLITLGMDYEVQQRRLGVELKQLSAHATDDQKARWKVKANILRNKIMSWIEVEHMYIPALHLIRHRESDSAQSDQEETPVFSVPLYLPSAICSRATCDRRLLDIEWELRNAQCTDALDDIRNALCLRAYLLIDRTRFQRGQKANTRSQSVVNRIQAKLEEGVVKYRVGRSALSNLSDVLGKIDWTERLPVLHADDIRALGDEEGDGEKSRKKGTSEGRRTISWIWTRGGGEINQSNDQRLHESLRIEWCKGRARRDRWIEELELLQEEKRRVLAFFQHRASQWDQLASTDDMWMLPGVPPDAVAVNGRKSYAREQAAQFRRMAQHSSHILHNVDSYITSNGSGVDLLPKGHRRYTVDDSFEEMAPRSVEVVLDYDNNQ